MTPLVSVQHRPQLHHARTRRCYGLCLRFDICLSYTPCYQGFEDPNIDLLPYVSRIWAEYHIYSPGDVFESSSPIRQYLIEFTISSYFAGFT